MRNLDGMASLAAQYDGFIVDLWGVIHDGVRPYPGAVACLEALRGAGKRVVLLSNAPRTVPVVREVLRGLGIADDLYDGLMTSGDYCRQLLADGTDPAFGAAGRRLFHLGADKDVNVFAGLDYAQAATPAEADFVLNTGPNAQEGEGDIDPYLGRLRACAEAGLPMLCANPDLEVIRDGRRLICAGLMARYYEQMGGSVRWIGKPYAEVYEPTIAMLGVDKARVLAVGDALATDMRGAAAVGVDGCWVLGGIHQELIGDDMGLAADEARSAGLAPVATVPGFVW